MYSVLPSSPQPQFAGSSGGLMVPRCLPSGEKTKTALGPVAHKLPRTSIFRPSGRPPSSCAVVSKKTRPLLTDPAAATSYRIQMRRLSSEFDTYSVFSSGENAMPFGRVRSLMMTSAFPLLSLKTPLNGMSFSGSSSWRGSP